MNFVDNKNMKAKILKKNLQIILPILFLLMISLFDMYGASFVSPLYKNALGRQSVWIILGLIIFWMTYKVDMRLILKYSTLLYIAGIILLVLVLFIGKNINGAYSWFKIGPFSIQPSELFKFFYIIFLSKMIVKHKKGNFSLLLKVIFYTFIPCFLIFLEPDTGVVLMYILMMFGLLLASHIPKRGITVLTLVGLTFLFGFLGLYFLEKDLFIEIFGTGFFYRMDRLLSFANNSSYQLTNALVGIGASGLTGLGLESSKIYVPELTTDFAFTLSICNFGLILGLIIIAIYAYLLIVIYREIGNSKKHIHRCVLSGIFWMMSFQVAEHILMNIGLAPITGITLPFLSYGGSSLISYCMLFGLILKITTSNSSYS